jgi:ribonuclease R
MKKKKFKDAPKSKKLNAGHLQRSVLKYFQENPTARLNPRQLASRLNVSNNHDSMLHALQQLEASGQLKAQENFKFMLSRKTSFNKQKTYEGYVDVTKSGSAYIECEGLDDDVFVSAKDLGSALHGDRVVVSVWWRKGRQRPEGEVIKVVERVSDLFVGTLFLKRKEAVVVPVRPDISIEIRVDLADISDAEDGERVVVKVTEWHKTPDGSPRGVVTSVLGAEGSDLEMKTILINNGFNLHFPKEVLDEASTLAVEISEAEVQKRRDFRMVPTFTIDPEDAKDFDDALSIRKLENGNLEIGIHIADVSHFVKPGSALDKEGFKRSTSVYLVDRVLPMFPEKLSNELCSLRPDEDKLTYSVVFVFDSKDKIVERWMGRTIIHSRRRFSYEEAQEVLESGQGDLANELAIFNRIAKSIRTKRFQNGAIDFDMEEVRFRLDEDGVPMEVFVKDRKDAHMLIEEFMLLANREVATYIAAKGKDHEISFVYRVHDYPSMEKVQELAIFAKEMGFTLKVSSPKEISKSFNKLAEISETEPALKLLQPLAIRTMAKAEYSSNNIGHFGLAFEHYTHFTSPIRRYSDILAHRILDGNLLERTMRLNKDFLEDQCNHISLQERKAMNAERESIKYKQVEYIQKHVGEEFDGYISGIIDTGIFVELEKNKCEGLVGFHTMMEPYEVAEGRLRAKGQRSGQDLKMGDKVRVRIIDADLTRRQIDMELV